MRFPAHYSFTELSDLRAHLLKLTSLLELELDFSDHEELEFADRSELYTLACDIHQRLASLARSFEVGNALKNGISVAIVGKTNVGKSTLLNHLLHEEKAIVSDVHGTTRDFIEDTTIINGIQFRFVDTAGIRTTDDVVENIGIERTYQKLQEAKIVLWLIDQQPTEAEIEDIKERVADKKLIIVRNKIDKSTAHSTFNIQHSTFTTVDISAKYGTNIPVLEQLIVEAADIPQLSESDIVITSARHYSALLLADESLQRVIDSMNLGLSGDLLAEDLRIVIDHLAEITGEERITPQETLQNIFTHFCIGK
jgi:tRNA modification GTPase